MNGCGIGRILFDMKSVLFLPLLSLLALCACERQGPNESVTQPPPHVDATAPQSYANVVSRVAPAVITIHAELRQRAPQHVRIQVVSDASSLARYAPAGRGATCGRPQAQRTSCRWCCTRCAAGAGIFSC